MFHRQFLRETIPTALIVGTVLLLINHGDVILHGQAIVRLWIKAGATYCVPFIVSKVGVLIATRGPATGGTAEKESK